MGNKWGIKNRENKSHNARGQGIDVYVPQMLMYNKYIKHIADIIL